MTISEQINTLIKLDETFIALRITDQDTEEKEILSNMPDNYKEIYYSNHYNEIDDTFDFTEANSEIINYPNSEGNYSSDYIRIMESHGYYNLASFTVKGTKKLSCIVTIPRKPHDPQNAFNMIRQDLVNDIEKIIANLSKIATVSDFNFSTITNVNQ
ncbi:hypothetical protein RND59_19420 [Vibrio ruber]|uniref:hypothetical protein n=1 Tax=Vibrio ruber TaxID=184755 RepID=UPI002892F044|nr:hypothetical protein [Vibrio ruber]WNJ97371.1 hypothetical protein RND59_19420 [Vibrio ruber]